MFNWGKRKKWLVMSTLLVGVVLVSLLGVQVVDRGDAIDRSVKIGIGDGKVITLGHVVYAAGSVDYTYDGVDDDVPFQAALDALPATGGRLVDISAVQKNFSATVTRAIPNVTVEGSGFGSYFTNDGVTALFTAGGNGWTFSGLRTDAGGINMGATTGWLWTKVNNGTTAYDLRTPASSIVNGDLVASSITDSGLTSSRVPVIGVGGLLSDSANLTFDGTSLQVSGANVTRSATFVVAASDSSAASKAQADYVCDGTADYVQIQAAIDALPAGGGRVVLSEGTFTLDDVQAGEITTLLISNNATTVTGQGPATVLYLNTANENADRYTILIRGTAGVPLAGVHVGNFAIKGAGSNADGTIDTSQKHGIIFTYVNDLLIENIWGYDIDEELIQGLGANEDGKVERVIIRNVFAHDIGGSVVDISSNTTKQCIIDGVTAKNVMVNAQQAGEGAIEAWSSEAASITPPTDLTISNIDIDTTTQGRGIRIVGAQRLNLSNIRLKTIDREGVTIYAVPTVGATPYDHQFANIYIQDCGSSANETSFKLSSVNYANLTNIEVVGAYGSSFEFNNSAFLNGSNLIARDSQGNESMNGFHIWGTSNNNSFANIIVDNISGTGARGIRLSGDYNKITGFYVESVNSQGIWAEGDYNIFHNGRVEHATGAVADTGTGNKFYAIEGYVTENSDTATLLAGGTVVQVTHNLDVTPGEENISLTPLSTMGNASYLYISDNATKWYFWVNSDVDPSSANITVGWSYSNN